MGLLKFDKIIAIKTVHGHTGQGGNVFFMNLYRMHCLSWGVSWCKRVRLTMTDDVGVGGLVHIVLRLKEQI